jgi:putative tricarboxylic transport membrane protein
MRPRVPGLLLTLAGAGIGLEATTFEVRFMTDPVGPKALPYLVALMLLLAGAKGLVRPDPASSWPARATVPKLAAATVAFLTYSVALTSLGFFLSTTLVVAALSHLYGAPVRHGVPAAALLSGALWLLFVHLLALPLPVGTLWMR